LNPPMDPRVTEFHCIMPMVNIPSVLKHGILSYERTAKVAHASVAMQPVQDRRDVKRVPGGLMLHRYANLYFHARNPMMFKRQAEAPNLCVLRVSTAVAKLIAFTLKCPGFLYLSFLSHVCIAVLIRGLLHIVIIWYKHCGGCIMVLTYQSNLINTMVDNQNNEELIKKADIQLIVEKGTSPYQYTDASNAGSFLGVHELRDSLDPSWPQQPVWLPPRPEPAGVSRRPTP